MSPTANWVRLVKVQRRVRHVRRVAATLLNHTKGWSSLRWGRNAKSTKVQEKGTNDFEDLIDSADASVTEACFTAKRVIRTAQKFVKLVRSCLTMILAMLRAVVEFGSRIGSFMYFVHTSWKMTKLIGFVVGSAATVKVTRDMIERVPKYLGSNTTIE